MTKNETAMREYLLQIEADLRKNASNALFTRTKRIKRTPIIELADGIKEFLGQLQENREEREFATETDKANARLMEAAPELLSLSRRLLFYAYKEYKAVEEPYRYEIKAIINEAEELFARILEEEKEA